MQLYKNVELENLCANGYNALLFRRSICLGIEINKIAW
jgi:hypothetical protein